VPPGKTFFCVEPTSQANDGMNLLAKGRTETGVVVLAPGERLAGTVLFSVTRHAPAG
jgi:galactose mutarotase-like enzyme